ncbi:hypothetical protein HYT57_03555 [Candidatus Woesearchaeota archaeon]|nr:hypothetical protein [Candidatus Woesearchaeota archaeon]
MADLREILIKFIRTNGLEARADFQMGKKPRKVYSWFDGSIKTEKQVKATPEFEGFLDGYQGRPNLYEGSGVLSGRRAYFIQELVNSAETMVAAIGGVQDAGLSAKIREAAGEAMQETPLERYNEQYKLGLFSSRK